MATLGTSVLTLADVAKSFGPDGQVMTDVAELLSQTNDIIPDILWKEGNLPTGHRMLARTSLPSINWRRANKGVALGKSTKAQFDEVTGRMEAWSEVDEMILDISSNPAATRMDEASAFIEAMGQELADTLFAGNVSTAPDEFTGLGPRYNAAVSGTTVYYDSMINGQGSGNDNTSVWLVGWGNNKVFGIYPKGSSAGLSRMDQGKQILQENTGDQATSRRVVYSEQFKWDCGIAVQDWRYVVRICNVDVSNVRADSGAADLVKLMIAAVERIPNLSACQPRFYMNRTLKTALRIQGLNKSSYQTTFETVAGKPVTMFDGIPVRTVDALGIAEAAISFS